MTRVITFHSDQRMSPQTKEILQVAVRSVFGDEKVTFKKVDTPTAQTLCFGTKVGGIRTMSPKQIVSAPNAISVLTRSLELARDGVSARAEDMKHEVVKDDDEFFGTLNWMAEVGYAHPVCVDLEWGPSTMDYRILSVAVTYGKNVVVFPEEYCQGEHLVKIVGALAMHYYVIGANWKGDAGHLLDKTKIKVPVWFDTMLAHHSLHPSATGQHGLKQMAERILGIPDWDKDIQKYTGAGAKGKEKDFSKVPRDLLYKYNAYDVFYTFRLYVYLLAQIDPHDHPYWTEQYWANGFIDIEHNRVHLDMDAVADLRDILMAEEAEHEAWLQEHGIFNPRSPQQVKARLQQDIPELDKTDAKTLGKYKDNEIVQHLFAYRKAQKKRGTYCDAYMRFEKDGMIHPTINIHGTGSGRMSGSDPNVQNVPRDPLLRKLFQARAEDRVIISCDYSQAELRVQAVLSGDPDMIAAFQPDAGDFFDLLMPVAFPNDFPTLADYKALKAVDKPRAKEYRAKIKGVIYGLNFGRGPAAIAEAINDEAGEGSEPMTKAEAQEIIDGFMNGYPLYKEWREKVVVAAVNPEEREFLTGPYGLVFDSEVVTWRNEDSVSRSALSFLPQNCVSYLCTTAAVRIEKRLRDEGWDAMVQMAVHDDILVDCLESQAEEVGKIMQYEMELIGRQTFGDALVFAAEPEWAYRWGDMTD